MAWVILILAGIFEVVWAYSMKLSGGFTKLTPSPNAAVKNDFLHCRPSCYALVKVLLSMLKLPLVVMPV